MKSEEKTSIDDNNSERTGSQSSAGDDNDRSKAHVAADRTSSGPATTDGDTSNAVVHASSASQEPLPDAAPADDATEGGSAQAGRKALHEFFYPSRPHARGEHKSPSTPRTSNSRAAEEAAELPEAPNLDHDVSGDGVNRNPSRIAQDPAVHEQEREDKEYIDRFWTAYDDIIILSLFTQIGILCRLGAATFFRAFDSVFHQDSALFTNLPLNCLSTFVMGLLCSGESLMSIVTTRFTPPRLQQDLHREAHDEEGNETETNELPDDDEFREVSIGEASLELSPTGNRSLGARWRRRRQQRRENRRQKRDRRRLHTRKSSHLNSNFSSELREVQLLALERRMRLSPCLVLFPVKKEDVDVVDSYFNRAYRRRESDDLGGEEKEEVSPWNGESRDETAFDLDNHELALDIEVADDGLQSDQASTNPSGMDVPNVPSQGAPTTHTASQRRIPATSSGGRQHNFQALQIAQVEGNVDYATQAQPDLDQIISNVPNNVSENVSRMTRVHLADGWDVGTTPEEKSADLMLGLRDGLCGALSSFSSWISSMVNLLRTGQIGQAFVGIIIGIQLPIVAYRFGQHIAVYTFVWRCRRETRREERRGGYGIRLSMDDNSSHDEREYSFDSAGDHSAASSTDDPRNKSHTGSEEQQDSETPSVRAIATALFIMSLVAQITSLNFFYEPEDRLVAMSLLFSPLGVLARWRLSKYNSWRPSFPIGTFACNISACALSGTLGTLLAGNPGPRERLTLVAVIAGFGGTLSSVARFIVEILEGMDPMLFRMDGVYYAICSVGWGLLVSFVFAASVDWADSVEEGD